MSAMPWDNAPDAPEEKKQSGAMPWDNAPDAPDNSSLLDKFAKPFKEGNWENESIIAPAIKYTAGSIAPDTFPNWKQEGEQNLINKGKAIGQGINNLVQHPIDTATAIAKHIYDNPAGFAGELAKGVVYDPEMLLLPGGPGVKGTARVLENVGTDVSKIGKTAIQTPKAIKEGWDVAKLGEHGQPFSAYQPVNPAALQQLSPFEQARIATNNNLLPVQGRGAQAFGENLYNNINPATKSPAELAQNIGLGILTHGTSVPYTLAKTYIFKPAVKTLLDTSLGKKAAEIIPNSEGELLQTKNGLVGGANNSANSNMSGAVNINPATGAIAPAPPAPPAPPHSTSRALVPVNPNAPTPQPTMYAGRGGVSTNPQEAFNANEQAFKRQFTQPVEPKPVEAAPTSSGPEIASSTTGNTPADILAQIRARGAKAINPIEAAKDTMVNGPTPLKDASLRQQAAAHVEATTQPVVQETAPPAMANPMPANTMADIAARPRINTTPPTGIEALRQKIMANAESNPANLFEGEMTPLSKDDIKGIKLHDRTQQQAGERKERKTVLSQMDLLNAAKKMNKAKTDYEYKLAKEEYDRISAKLAENGGDMPVSEKYSSENKMTEPTEGPFAKPKSK